MFGFRFNIYQQKILLPTFAVRYLVLFAKLKMLFNLPTGWKYVVGIFNTTVIKLLSFSLAKPKLCMVKGFFVSYVIYHNSRLASLTVYYPKESNVPFDLIDFIRIFWDSLLLVINLSWLNRCVHFN